MDRNCWCEAVPLSLLIHHTTSQQRLDLTAKCCQALVLYSPDNDLHFELKLCASSLVSFRFVYMFTMLRLAAQFSRSIFSPTTSRTAAVANAITLPYLTVGSLYCVSTSRALLITFRDLCLFGFSPSPKNTAGLSALSHHCRLYLHLLLAPYSSPICPSIFGSTPTTTNRVNHFRLAIAPKATKLLVSHLIQAF